MIITITVRFNNKLYNDTKKVFLYSRVELIVGVIIIVNHFLQGLFKNVRHHSFYPAINYALSPSSSNETRCAPSSLCIFRSTLLYFFQAVSIVVLLVCYSYLLPLSTSSRVCDCWSLKGLCYAILAFFKIPIKCLDFKK